MHNTDYANEVHAIIDSFDYELCSECGRDLEWHIISRDMLGKARAWCMTRNMIEGE